ncbi:hypothetical protein D9M72_557660 [compost metagenome]
MQAEVIHLGKRTRKVEDLRQRPLDIGRAKRQQADEDDPSPGVAWPQAGSEMFFERRQAQHFVSLLDGLRLNGRLGRLHRVCGHFELLNAVREMPL